MCTCVSRDYRCNGQNAVDAPTEYRATLYVKHPSYRSVKDKYCKSQNDIYESPLDGSSPIKSAEGCMNKCTADPKCVSAEWYAASPLQCDLSSTCTGGGCEGK